MKADGLGTVLRVVECLRRDRPSAALLELERLSDDITDPLRQLRILRRIVEIYCEGDDPVHAAATVARARLVARADDVQPAQTLELLAMDLRLALYESKQQHILTEFERHRTLIAAQRGTGSAYAASLVHLVAACAAFDLGQYGLALSVLDEGAAGIPLIEEPSALIHRYRRTRAMILMQGQGAQGGGLTELFLAFSSAAFAGETRIAIITLDILAQEAFFRGDRAAALPLPVLCEIRLRRNVRRAVPCDHVGLQRHRFPRLLREWKLQSGNGHRLARRLQRPAGNRVRRLNAR